MTIAPLSSACAEQILPVIDLLEGKWTIHILCAMCEHPVRLSELRRALPNASKKSLTASLRSLEAAKAVVRRDLSNSRLHVEYELTESARESLPTLLGIIAEWRTTHEELFASP